MHSAVSHNYVHVTCMHNRPIYHMAYLKMLLTVITCLDLWKVLNLRWICVYFHLCATACSRGNAFWAYSLRINAWVLEAELKPRISLQKACCAGFVGFCSLNTGQINAIDVVACISLAPGYLLGSSISRPLIWNEHAAFSEFLHINNW